MVREMRDDEQLESRVGEMLADPQYQGHPLQEALAALFGRYQDHLTQLERLTSISDGYHSAMREQNQSLTHRYRKQMRQLQKIIRISDHYQEMLRESNHALKAASTHDLLTGLPNRRLMLERLTTETALTDRRQMPFSLALIDIDHFKSINDQFGHDVGDRVLVDIAHALTDGLRAYDICARWGGEEFMVLLPETPGISAVAIADRLRALVSVLRHPGLPDTFMTTLSIGVAEKRPEDMYNETIKRSDRALYQAKRNGRNCVALAD